MMGTSRAMEIQLSPQPLSSPPKWGFGWGEESANCLITGLVPLATSLHPLALSKCHLIKITKDIFMTLIT